MKKKTYNVLIVGAGAIGAFYDTPDSDNVLTHAHAFAKHKGFELLGFVDIKKEKAREASEIWGGKCFDNIEQAFEEYSIDIVSVCVPDEFHYKILKMIADYPVKIIFAEKPLTKTLPEAKEIVLLYSKKNIPMCVNYRRRFLPEIEEIKESIDGNELGKFITGTGYYGKGLLHNGSHLIDLIIYLIGNKVVKQKVIQSQCDYYENDPSVSATLFFEGNRPFYLQCVDCNYFAIFEVDFIFEKGRFRLTNTGLTIEYFSVKKNNVFKDYSFLEKVEEASTSLFQSLFWSAENIYNFLTNNEELKCSMIDAFETMLLCDKIKSGA
jgi:predicted dehydrogenase